MEQFKVGVWVKHENGTIEQWKGYDIPSTGWSLWQPKEGEWCWFMNCYSPRLSRYRQTRTVSGNNSYIDIYGDDYVDIEPFIGTLPSFIKE